MVKQLFSAIIILLVFTSCSSLKQLGFSQNNHIATPAPGTPAVEQAKFIKDITITPPANTVITPGNAETKQSASDRSLEITTSGAGGGSDNIIDYYNGRSAESEISAVQVKYSILLNTEVENLQNKELLEGVDVWYGTRYRMGGTTKKGIDCSAFVGAVYASVFGISLPRTARDQYKTAKRISRTELQEGDLLFFNTRGGISHVGIYLQNNKFIHASVSKGVTVDDLFEPYYIKRFVAAGRIEKNTLASKSVSQSVSQ